MSKHVLASITRDCSVDGMVQQAPADRKLKHFLHRHLGSTLFGPAQCCPPAGSPHLGLARVLAHRSVGWSAASRRGRGPDLHRRLGVERSRQAWCRWSGQAKAS